ncbi:MAG: GerW family sporulation protein [Lachnospiraceae bacterium]
MAENEKFNTTMESLFKGMDSFISAKTVVGDAVNINDTIILPLVDVAFGVGAGASNGDRKGAASGGMGGKLTPSAVLVIKGDQIRLVNVKNQDAITKIIDMVPDLINKFTGKNEDVLNDSQVSAAVNDALASDEMNTSDPV